MGFHRFSTGHQLPPPPRWMMIVHARVERYIRLWLYGYRVMTGRDPGQTCKPIFRNRYVLLYSPLLSRPTVRHAEYIDGVWDRCDAYRVWTSIFSTICIKSKSRGSSNDIVIAPSCAGFLFVRDDFFFFFYLVRLVV